MAFFYDDYQHGRYEDALKEARALESPGELRQELNERHGFSPDLTDHLLEGLAKAGAEMAESGPE